MDIGTVVRNAVKVERMERFGQSAQLSLGELIVKLEQMPDDAPVVIDQDRPVGHLTSWRGSYDELAITPSLGPFSQAHTVATLTNLLRAAIGQEFDGYKGGTYRMGRHTPVWVAEWGTAGDDAVVGVVRDGDRVVIETAEIEY